MYVVLHCMNMVHCWFDAAQPLCLEASRHSWMALSFTAEHFSCELVKQLAIYDGNNRVK